MEILECQNQRRGRRCGKAAVYAVRYRHRGKDKMLQKMVCHDCRYAMGRRGHLIVVEHLIAGVV